MLTAPLPVNRSSSRWEMGLAGGGSPCSSSTFMAGEGSGDCVMALTEGVSPVPGAIAISDSAASPSPWSGKSSSWVALSPWLAPSETGLVVGDNNLEVLNVLPFQVYLPFKSLPSRCIRFHLVSLDEVIQLHSDLCRVPLELG